MIRIDKNSKTPLYKQIYTQIQESILTGKMSPGHILLGSRVLSKEIGVGRNTINSAYAQLTAEGYIEAQAGIGFVVLDVVNPKFTHSNPISKEKICMPKKPNKQVNIKYDLSYGNLTTGFFSYRLWKRYMTEAMPYGFTRVMNEYMNHQGDINLRKELAGYLNRSRGVICSENQIILTSGLQHSLEIICKLVYKKSGSVAIEEPGYDRARIVFKNNELNIIPLTIDNQGATISSLAKNCAVQAIFITPSYQFPTGVIMSIRRRFELLEWAKKNNTFIIEDDYNGEFRYDGNPIPSLQSFDKYENVIYLGSISKSLAPFMNISYIVLPNRIMNHYKEFYQLYSCHIPWINQYIVQRFIEDGHYEKHIRKIRHMYSKRHNLLLKELSLMSNHIEIVNRGAGLYFILKIFNASSNKWLVEKALEQGVKVISTTRFWQNETLCPQNEIFLGFSLIDLSDVRDCVSKLKRAWF